MYKTAFISLLLVLSAVTSIAQDRENSSRWHTEEHDNIPVTKYLYNKNGEVFYLFTNDNNNLYVHLRAHSVKAQRQMLMQGVTVSLKTKVKDKKKPSIQFPLNMRERMELSGQPIEKTEKGRKDFDAEKNRLINQVHDIKLIGFSKEDELIPTINKDNISGDIHFNEHGELLYKLVIPFKTLGLDNNVKTLNIALSSEYSGSSDNRQSGAKMRPSGGGGMGGAQGGMRGGGMGGPGMSGGGRGGMGGGPGMGRGGSGMQGKPSQDTSTSINIKIKKLEIAHQ